MFLYALEESVDCHLLSSFCDDSNLHISLFKYVLSTMGVSKESISNFKKFADRFLAYTHRGKYILELRKLLQRNMQQWRWQRPSLTQRHGPCGYFRSNGVRKGGILELTPPLSLICYKNFITCAKVINCFRILFACYFVDLMQIPRNKFACKF